MALARRDYCDTLVQAGVNEFFVSVPGHDAASHDAITGVPGSFEKTLRGLENLEDHPGVISITNTVVTARNYRTLGRVVDSLGHLQRLAQMEFWYYWPMRETDERSLIVPLRDALPPLREAIGLAREAGRSVEIKNFPHCLLGDLAPLLVNDQPPLIIDDRFWGEFQRNGFHECVHRAQCRSEQCLGLNAAYVARFGWERELLRPVDVEGRSLPERGP
jgi:MoaA/NifB/PqqE/SkfB family radical SAM enzyme